MHLLESKYLVALSPAGFSESFQNLPAAVLIILIINRGRRTNKNQRIFHSLLWQPRLDLLSRFSCPDNERPNLRSRRLVVVFPLKANLLVRAIFEQRIPFTGWLYN